MAFTTFLSSTCYKKERVKGFLCLQSIMKLNWSLSYKYSNNVSDLFDGNSQMPVDTNKCLEAKKMLLFESI